MTNKGGGNAGGREGESDRTAMRDAATACAWTHTLTSPCSLSPLDPSDGEKR